MILDWPHDRCIVCLRRAALTKSHVIPGAAGGRLCAPLECRECNSRLGTSIEAGLKSDPIVRLAIEALGEQVPRLQSQMHARERFVATDDNVKVYAHRTENGYRVLDTAQDDGSVVKEPRRARQDIETTLRRRGVAPAEVAGALAKLDEAPVGQMVAVGPGIAARRSAAGYFAPDYASAKPIPDKCLLSIAYRWLALVMGPAIYDPVLNGIRTALLGTDAGDGWRVDWLVAQRPHEPWHGLDVPSVLPHVVVHVRLFGQLAWNIGFTQIALTPEPALRTYEIDLTKAEGERFGSGHDPDGSRAKVAHGHGHS